MRADIIASRSSFTGARHYVPSAPVLGCPPLIRWRTLAASSRAPRRPERDQGGHDLKRASIALSRASAPLTGPMFDTMLAAYLIDPEAGNDLKDLARRELGLPIARYDDVTGKGAPSSRPSTSSTSSTPPRSPTWTPTSRCRSTRASRLASPPRGSSP